MPANVENSAVATELERSFSLQSPKKKGFQRMFNHLTVPLTHMLPKEFIQASLQQYMNCEIPYVQAGFRKGRGTRDQIANIRWMIEKARGF